MASSDKNYLKSLKWFSSWDYTSWIKSEQTGSGKGSMTETENET